MNSTSPTLVIILLVIAAVAIITLMIVAFIISIRRSRREERAYETFRGKTAEDDLWSTSEERFREYVLGYINDNPGIRKALTSDNQGQEMCLEYIQSIQHNLLPEFLSKTGESSLYFDSEPAFCMSIYLKLKGQT